MEVKKSHEKYYDEYVERQMKMGVNHRHLSVEKLVLKQIKKKESNILEIGAGIGTVTGLLAESLKKSKIVVNDLSSKSIEAAKLRLSRFNNLTYLVGDIVNLEIKDRFDYVVLADVMEHIPKEEHTVLLRNIAEILNEDGEILIHIPNPHYLDWATINRPELLQELDQPLHTDEFAKSIYDAGLYIQSLNNYSIYVKENDYQFLVVKKSNDKKVFTSSGIKSQNIIQRGWNKLKRKLSI